MRFEWDQAKNAANIAKHGVDFADACRIFEGPVITDLDDRKDYGEVRYRTYGRLNDVLIVAVSHTPRRGFVRIISARPASRAEMKRYDETVR